MTPIAVEWKDKVCAYSNQNIDTCRVGASSDEPYLFASSEDRTVWYDAKALVKEQVRRVHLFALFSSGVFFVAECASSYLKPLYLCASKESLKAESNDEALVDALSYHYKGSVEKFQISGELFAKVKEGVLDHDPRLACVLGRVFLRVNNERNLALIYLVQSAKMGNIKAAAIAGQMFLKGVPQVVDAAGKKQARLLLEKVPQDDLDAQTLLSLGKLYLDNEETQKAIDLFHRLAKKEDPEGCYQFALMLPEGESEEMRYKWFEKAALTGHPLASFKAAMILEKRAFTNYPLKRRFFLQAAVKGNREAAFHAGVMCRKGLGGEKLLERAQELFLESKMGGEAYYELGLVNMELEKQAEAIEYFRLAAAEKHESAKKELEKLGVSEKNSSRKSGHSKSDSGSSSGRAASTSPGSSSRKKNLVEYTRSLSEGEEPSRRGSHEHAAEGTDD